MLIIAEAWGQEMGQGTSGSCHQARTEAEAKRAASEAHQGIGVSGVGDYDTPDHGCTNNYDDPYKMLTTYLVSVMPVHDLRRFMVDNDFVRQSIIHSIQESDISDPYVDCVQDEMLRNRKKRKYKQALNVFAAFIYSQLDVKRLRQDIYDFALGCGVDLLSE